MKLAFSGHIDLFKADEKIIYNQIKQKLEDLNQFHKIEEVIVGVAEGADQICISCCKELNITITYLNDKVVKNENEPDSLYYERQCIYMVKHFDHFMVVWDGLFTEKLGGTSWLVQLLLQHSEKKVIHHLITPRKSNPYPINYLSSKSFNPYGKQMDSRLPWLPKFYWASFEIGEQVERKLPQSNIENLFDGSLWKTFIIPGILAFITLILGTIGYCTVKPENTVLDSIFKSIDFITLNELHFNNGNIFLHISRFTGILTPLTAIGFGVYSATYNLRIRNKLRQWLKASKRMVIVVGENSEANDLIKDLNLRGLRVLQFKTNQQKNSLTKINNNHLIESIYSGIDKNLFDKIISKASLVYLMNTDEINLQDALRFESFSKGKNLSIIERIFVHLKSDEKAKFLHNISIKLIDKFKIFNIQHNTVRRLLNYFPIDQENKEINVFTIHIVDFNSLSQILIEHLLAQLYLERHISIELNVYSENLKSTKIEFYKKFSALKGKNEKNRIEHYNWGNWEINFLNYSTEISSKQIFLEKIENDLELKKSISLYVCIQNGSLSSTWLSSYLPRLNQLKKDKLQHLQVFSFYNSPNIQEEIQIERYYNKLAPHLFVTCFGNYLQECSFDSINLDTLDELAIKIADWYDKKYNLAASPHNRNWHLSSYMDKQSNRHAADHIWLKWRWLLRNTNRNTHNAKYSIDTFSTLENSLLMQLSEIEHRRWCANLVLKGHHVLPEKYSKEWLKNKQHFKSQYYHKDLVSFNKLKGSDQEKDSDQIQGIPDFILNTYLKN